MTELRALGDALEAGVRDELQTRRRHRRARSLALIATVPAIVIPSAAIAAAHFLSNADVARSLPAGSLILAGTEPSCTTVRQDVEYHCVLAHPPDDGARAGLIKGTVYETVDSTQHVNGGCRSLNDAGTEWECYIGEEAVKQKIISRGFLGEVQTTPAVG